MDIDTILMENPLIFRQGDVLLTQLHVDPKLIGYIDKPLQEDKTVAFGEQTGHSHRFRGNDQVLVYKDPSTNEPDIVVVNEKATLEHQEHLPLEIPPGVYARTIQVEHNPFTERSQQVYD